MSATAPDVPPRARVREVAIAPITARPIGPPSVCATWAIAASGPISCEPTPAIAHSGSGTTARPTPNPTTSTRTNSVGTYATVCDMVDPYSRLTAMIRAPVTTSHRGRTRTASFDATAAAAPSPKANGTNARPACSGEYPRMSCTNRATNAARLNMTAPAKKIDTNVATRSGLRNSTNGSRGFSARRSTTRNTASSAAPASSAPTTAGLLHPISGPSVSPKTRPVQPSVASTAPGTSSGSRSAAVSRSAITARVTIRIPIGTLIRKIQRQDTSVRAPPMISPAIEPTPVMAAKMAIAWLRAGPGAKVVATSARAVGEATAAPTPCSARAATRVPSLTASPHSSEASVNNPTPAMNMRLRPKASPRRPPSSMRPP